MRKLTDLFQKILVPIDGSSWRIFMALIEVLHVMTFTEDLPSEPEKSEKTDSPSAWIEDYMTRIRVRSERMLNASIEEAKTLGLAGNVASKLLIGRPGDAILSEAAQGGFDLIVIGSRGLGSFKEFVLGSVSHQVVNESKIPVLVVK